MTGPTKTWAIRDSKKIKIRDINRQSEVWPLGIFKPLIRYECSQSKFTEQEENIPKPLTSGCHNHVC